MISLTGAGKRYGPRVLFEGLNWLITSDERAGIVGGNGTGKSTLLKILCGIEALDEGEIVRARGITLGYLQQEGLELSDRTVFAECLSVFDNLHAMEREMEELAVKIGELDPSGADYEFAADRFHRLQNEFTHRDGYSLEAKVGTVLAGLQFPKDDWSRPASEFSGGWQMRIALAKLLLEEPNLLLLDEPTNHLDLEARNWLESYLNNYPYAYVLISHDRYFLDVTTRRIVEVWNRKVHFYPGNYEQYLAQKAERVAQITAAYNNQQAKIQQLEAFISRFRAQATKAKQVQSRIKEIERMEKAEPPPPEEKAIHFSFPQPKPSGRIVAECAGVRKSYGAKFVFGDVDFVIERGDKIALVGPNGAGKSTLIKILAGAEAVSAGEYRLGHNAMLQYFAQDQYKELDPAATLLDDISAHAPLRSTTELRSLLGCFLFSEDDVYKRMGVLSGGERNRYALARLLLEPANFLLLDEPTNHLDMRAKDILLTALREYTGTVVFVSHDRYFLDQLATRVFEIGEGEVRVFPGGYEDYLWRTAGRANQEAGAAPEPFVPTLDDVPGLGSKKEPSAPAPASRQRVNPLKLQKMRDRQAEIEAAIARLETAIAADERELAHFRSAEETGERASAVAANRREIERLMGEWEQTALALEAAGGAA